MKALRIPLLISALVAATPVSVSIAQTPPPTQPQTPPQTQPPSPPQTEPPTSPEQTEALEAANELFALLSKDLIDQLAAQLTARIWPVIDRDLVTRGVDDATRTQLRGEFERIQLDYLREVMKDGPKIYARHFTAPELREITAFYRTPTGAKTLRVLPVVTAEIMSSLMPRLQEVQQATQEAFARILIERGYLK